MKQQRYLIVPLACIAMALSGCGKSAGQKQMEADLNAEVTSLQETIKAGLDGALRSVNATLATHDSLVAASPKGARIHKADDLKSAAEGLKAAKVALDDWMAGYNPYDAKMSHQDAMALLNRHKEDLTAMQSNLEAAISQANTAIASHSKDRKELQTQMGKRAKKP
ncbi:MAG: hypothetical protein ONA90_00935 [candidate division KSB1 bacterium]|nr:hypothetical protein [candidate division KSB1 bacterium]